MTQPAVYEVVKPCLIQIDVENESSQQANNEDRPFPFVSAASLTDKPAAIDWLVPNMLERATLNLMFGESASGKSVLATELAYCIASGQPWGDIQTQQAPVLIIVGEGFNGYRRRLRALEIKHGVSAPADLYISERPGQLLDPANVSWIADTINELSPNPGLVIIDTLHRNMEGDENSSADIAKLIGNVDTILKPLGAAVLFIHHSGHGDKNRSRGSSSIRAAMDAEFSVVKRGDSVTLSCTKAKDFEPFAPRLFNFRTVELSGWTDHQGETMTSVVLENKGEAKPEQSRPKLSARDDLVLTSLFDAIRQHGIEPPADIKEKFAGFSGWKKGKNKVVSIEKWRTHAHKAIVVDSDRPDAKRMAFKRCRDRLVNNGYIIEFNDFVWPVFKTNTPNEREQNITLVRALQTERTRTHPLRGVRVFGVLFARW